MIECLVSVLLWGAPSDAVSVQVRAPITEVGLGDAFRLEVVRTWPLGWEAEPFDDRDLEPLVVERSKATTTKHRESIVETLEYRAFAFALDELIVPSVVTTVRSPDGTPINATSDALSLSVKRALDPSAPGEPELPGGIRTSPMSRALVLSLGIGTIVLIALAEVWYRRRVRKRSRPVDAKRAAMSLFGELRRPRPSPVDWPELYGELNRGIKAYFETEFQCGGAEQTNEEFLECLAGETQVSGDTQRELTEFFARCDAVKFGSVANPEIDWERWIDQAEAWVQASARLHEAIA